MTIFILLLFIPSLYAGLVEDTYFQLWRLKYDKQYENQETAQFRYRIWKSNREKIDNWNSFNATDHGYTMEMNQFGDLSSTEFAERVLNPSLAKSRSSSSGDVDVKVSFPSGLELPDSIDWRQKGAVTPAKDQGTCGSCWSFASTGCMEGAYQIRTGNLVSMSEQFLIDCEPTNLGCRGGLAPNVYNWITHTQHGVETEKDYPYNGTKGQCHQNKTLLVDTGFTTYKELDEGDEDGMGPAVAMQPLSIGMDAGGDGSFQFYKNGIFKSSKCSKVIDHAVTLIGYGESNGEKYWVVKNSWGQNWGMEGFFWIQRGTNMCGVAEYVSWIN